MLADWLEQIAAELERVGVKALSGAENIVRQDRVPPSVVMVPTEEQYREQTRGGGFNTGGPGQQRLTRSATVVAHCWAVGSPGKALSDFRAAEALSNRVLLALEKVAPGHFRVLGGQWEDTAGQSLFSRGRVYLLSVALDSAVLEPAPTEYLEMEVVTVEAQALGGALEVIQPTTLSPLE